MKTLKKKTAKCSLETFDQRLFIGQVLSEAMVKEVRGGGFVLIDLIDSL